MKISIDNFKTIHHLEDFDLKALNIISGVNSSGKSSLIQFLLLLKQTIELNAANSPLIFNSDHLIQLGDFLEVVYRQDPAEKISFRISFDDQEFTFSQLGTLKIKQFDFTVIFCLDKGNVAIDKLELKYYIPETIKKEQWVIFERVGNRWAAKANTGLFNNDFFQLAIDEEKDYIEGEMLFTSFFPQTFTTEVPNPDYPNISRNRFKQYSIEPEIGEIRSYIESEFKKISYIGPLRRKPSDTYLANKRDKSVGTEGEFAAYILETEAPNRIQYYSLPTTDNGIFRSDLKEGTFAEAVNYWICEVFNLATKIHVEESQELYIVKIVNHFGVETTIKHVGFGVSQVLPIVVEGLRMRKGGTLILEQPEIHLHPKVQSLLFDFLYSLTLNGKQIIVETHSDNLVIRMRRRIAEDMTTQVLDTVNLIFVEERENEHLFRKLDMTDLGSMTYFPKDFIEQQDDYRAIVQAQAFKKRKQ